MTSAATPSATLDALLADPDLGSKLAAMPADMQAALVAALAAHTAR